MSDKRWSGVFPALTTPFTAADAVDLDALSALIEFQLEAGVHGLVLNGSLGENSTLGGEEQRSILRQALEVVRGRVPVLLGVAESSTKSAVGLVRDACDIGADGFMLLPPMRYPSDRRETLTYLRTVAAASERPIMLYNNPVAYGTDLLPEDFLSLADADAFVAIKESSADTRRIPELRRLCDDRFQLFCGVDDLAFESLALGADGWVAGLVVAFPRETVALWALARAGRWDEARALYEWFLPLLHLDVGPKFVQQIKWVQHRMGVGPAACRAPRLALSDDEAGRVDAVLDAALETRPAV